MSLNALFNRRYLLRAALAMMVALVAPLAHAQFRASIQGTVTDPQGEVIPGATLTLTDTDTNRVLTATSNASGVYNFNALPPDHFTLAADATGFKHQVINGVRIIPEQANAVNVRMDLGEATTSVTVSGETVPALDTETASINGSVDSNQIEHLPSSGRDVFTLIQLAPGVFGDQSQSAGGGVNNLPGTQGPGGSGSGIFQTENGPQANANGGQYETNGISVDGISTVSAVWGGTSVITPNEDSVGNVKVVSNGYDAENGRFSGAQIQVTSKTGTNQFHGSLFFRANRPGLNAYQRYNGAGSLKPITPGETPAQRGLQRDELRSNQFGGSIGGPILHDKLFAFFAYETQRDHSSSTGTGWYETADFRALAPSGSIASKFLSFPGAGVAQSGLINQTCADIGLIENVNCRTIAGQGLNLGSPLKQALGTQDLSWQSTSNPGIGGGLANVADIADYTTVNPRTSTQVQYNGRLDADITKKDHAAFAIYWVPVSTTNYNGSVRPYNLYHHAQINDAFSVIYNHTFSPTLLNEARANAAGWRWNEISTNPQAPFGLPSAQVDGLGNLSGSGALSSFGAPGPSDFDQWTYSYKDVATKVEGNHTVKFGGELTRLYYLNNPTYAVRPSYNFYNIWDFLNDAPHTESGSFDPFTGTPSTNRQDTREDLYGFFVQDDWKARQNLTINLGMRYGYYGPFSAKGGNLNTVVLGTGPTTFTGLSVRRGGNLYNAQKGNFGPQIGFAWSPDYFHGKFVLRGGYGLNYNQEEIAITGNSGNNPPNVINPNFASASPANINPGIIYAIPADSHSLFGYPANPNVISKFNSANLPVGGNASLTAFPANMPTIQSHHYSLDTQLDLGHQFVASVGYQGSSTHHIIVQQNQYVTAFAQGLAFNPLVTSVDYYGNTGNSSNNALLVGLKHQMAHNFMFDAEFNYSKTMDDGSGPYFEDPYPYLPGAARGRSDFNFGKALKIYGLWQPVLFHGNHAFLEKTFGGWSLSGIFNLHTGFPFTPIYNAGGNLYYASSGYSQLRPAAYYGGIKHNTGNDAFENGKPNVNAPLAGANQPYFGVPIAPVAGGGSSLATALGLPQRPGVSRNSFDGPGYKDLDATLTKSFGLPNAPILGENARFEIRADAFNLFNNINLNSSTVVTDITASNFGQATAGLAGRIINLQARFSF
ncbi:carboxypeptidase regulatory-like domain-containing protein [Edaphobacter paludis]|uniref:Carboxypeptidase regulatory-like domain-containing protein n=1 Tax=Edaphobacter paludis TaxID=3035702 RepID=A0AAU7D9I6_9BACT